MLADLNNIVVIIIAIVGAIIASLAKKKQPEQEWDLPPELKPRRDAPPPIPKASRWEEELRRVLQEKSALPPVARPVPPPLVQVEEEYQRSPDEGGSEEPVVARLRGLTEAASSQAHAASLLQRTQEQLHQLHGATHRAAAPASVRHVEPAPEIRELLKTLRQPHGARAAILASVVLGPPRAFEI